MGFRTNYETGEGLDGIRQEQPDWLTLSEGQTVRIAFLEYPYCELVYDIRDKNAPKEENYRGTYRSTTAAKGLFQNDIKRLVATKDPEGQLDVDAQILGVPNITAAVPVVVYPTDKNGKLNKADLKSGHFAFKIARLTQAKYRNLEKQALRLKDDDKTLFDVDFYISMEEKKRFPTWKFDSAGNSIYQKYKKNFEKKVKALAKDEYDRLGVGGLDDFAQFLARDLTDAQWIETLQDCGYKVANAGSPDFDDGLLDDETEGTESGDTSSPELEDEIPI